MHTRTIVIGLTLGFLFGACGQSTIIDNPDYCSNARGDETCAERFSDGSRPFCVLPECGTGHYGCVESQPEDPACWSPCGDKKSFADDPNCEGVVDDSSGTEGSTDSNTNGPSTSMGPDSDSDSDTDTTGTVPCSNDGECDGGTPFCGPAGVCVTCDGLDEPDAKCAEVSGDTPLCFEGACVACTADDIGSCGGTTPVCDVASSTCVGCSAHSQCPLSACHLLEGSCFDQESVRFVDAAGQGDFTTVGAAIFDIANGGSGVLVVYHAASDYNETVTIAQGKTVAILAAPGDTPQWVQTATVGPTLTITGGGTTVFMEGLRLAQNGDSDASAVRVNGGTAIFQRVRVLQNLGGGFFVEGGGDLVVENSFVGGDNNDAHAVDLRGSTASILYSTLATGFGDGSALFCDSQATVDVRNSILLNRDGTTPEVQCASANISNSGTEADVGNLVTGWFVGWGNGDFRLSASGQTAFENIARWETGDPLVDILGNDRPNVDGAQDFAGAHSP